MTRQRMSEKRAIIEGAIASGKDIAFDVPSSTLRVGQVGRPVRLLPGAKVVMDYGRGNSWENYVLWQNVRISPGCPDRAGGS